MLIATSSSDKCRPASHLAKAQTLLSYFYMYFCIYLYIFIYMYLYYLLFSVPVVTSCYAFRRQCPFLGIEPQKGLRIGVSTPGSPASVGYGMSGFMKVHCQAPSLHETHHALTRPLGFHPPSIDERRGQVDVPIMQRHNLCPVVIMACMLENPQVEITHS